MADITCGSIFGGVGGWEFGAHDLGVRPAWTVDIDPVASEYAALNHPGVDAICFDARRVYWRGLRVVDVLFASPPCQAFSTANGGKPSERHDVELGLVVLRAVRVLLPPLVLIENVVPFQNSKTFQRLMIGLFEVGYAVKRVIVDAFEWGVPQTRRRLIVIASRSGMRVPVPHKRAPSWRESLDDLMPTMQPATFAPWQHAKGLPPGDVDEYLVSGQNSRACGSRLWRYAHEPAFTVTAHANKGRSRCVMNGRTLRVGTREQARLQTFSDGTQWPAIDGHANRLIGNAVPPELARGVLSQVL